MGMPTPFSVNVVSELFFRHIMELSVRSLKELKDGSSRPELRLVRSFGSFHTFDELRSTSRLSRLVRA